MILPPNADEHSEYFGNYARLVPAGSDVFAVLAGQPETLRALVSPVSDADASVSPKAGEWSIKEVLGHINDTERIFAYRALRFSRGDTTPVAGFEQDDYVRATHFNTRSISSLLDEFALIRQANVVCFAALTEDEINRRGTSTTGSPYSVRALLFGMAGHVTHHVESLIRDYHVGG